MQNNPVREEAHRSKIFETLLYIREYIFTHFIFYQMDIDHFNPRTSCNRQNILALPERCWYYFENSFAPKSSADIPQIVYPRTVTLVSKETVLAITDSNSCCGKNERERISHLSLVSSSNIVFRFFSSRRRRLFYLVRAGVYTRNVINEHTRELSRTTEEGGEEEKRKRRTETKQRMYNEERGQGKCASEDLLWCAGEGDGSGGKEGKKGVAMDGG